MEPGSTRRVPSLKLSEAKWCVISYVAHNISSSCNSGEVLVVSGGLLSLEQSVVLMAWLHTL